MGEVLQPLVVPVEVRDVGFADRLVGVVDVQADLLDAVLGEDLRGHIVGGVGDDRDGHRDDPNLPPYRSAAREDRSA